MRRRSGRVASCYAPPVMRNAARFALVVLLLSGVGCGDDPPERDFSRPAEYRHSALEAILATQAKERQDRRDKVDARRAAERAAREAMKAAGNDGGLSEVPAGFPAAFVAFPDAEFEEGVDFADTSMVSVRVPGSSPDDVYAKAKASAAETGWQLELEAKPGRRQASFRKVAQRVDLRVDPHPNGGSKVIAILLDLEQSLSP